MLNLILVSLVNVVHDDDHRVPHIVMVRMTEGDFNNYVDLLHQYAKDPESFRDVPDEDNPDIKMSEIVYECQTHYANKPVTRYVTIASYYGSKTVEFKISEMIQI